ncbi:MAG: hypothetical protein IPJ65_34920 [Archangiaceae bacterium]|nr:hypothetical protein [Archangiaceae bacterium]
MLSRSATALLLAASLFGLGHPLALEPAAEQGESVSLAHPALAASSTVAAPTVVRGLDLHRPLLALPVAVPAAAATLDATAARVSPRAFAARPDLVTCPSQGPPRA